MLVICSDFEDRVYYFQLSVRRSSLKPKENSLYLTYLGSAQFPDGDPKKRISFEQKFKTTRSHRSCLCHFEECDKKLPRGQSKSFCTLAPGCGLIELSRHGVQPLPRLGTSMHLKIFIASPHTISDQVDNDIKEKMVRVGIGSNVSFTDFDRGGRNVKRCNIGIYSTFRRIQPKEYKY